MEKITLRSWSFVHVFQTILELAKNGGADLSNPGFLREVLNARTWEAMDELGRDPKHLHRLTPPLAKIHSAAVRYGVAEGVVADLYSRAVIADGMVDASVGEVGYTWLGKRQVAGQLLYALANQIQGDPHNGEGLSKRKESAEQLLAEFRGYGWGNPEPQVQAEMEYYERLLGMLFCLRVVAVLVAHPELDVIELTRHGLMKYGVRDRNGNCSCYWCTGSPCVDGGRKGGIKALLGDITSDLTQSHGLPEMDHFMWVVYGGSRNTAISALAGVVRSLSEDGGEFSWVSIMSRSGGTNDGIKARLGPLFLGGTRHVKMADKKGAENVPLLDSLYAEAADAVVSWPCLVHQAFGLSFVRSIRLGLEHMANGAGIELKMPEDLARTIPVPEKK